MRGRSDVQAGRRRRARLRPPMHVRAVKVLSLSASVATRHTKARQQQQLSAAVRSLLQPMPPMGSADE